MLKCMLHPIQIPIGHFFLLELDGKIIALSAPEELPILQHKLQSLTHTEVSLCEESTPVLLEAEKQFREYFSGTRRNFDLPIQLYGTAFQQSVWQQLMEIPYGQTITYGDIGKQLNQKGARVIGTAVGKNPLPIIVPCHRVLPASGKIGQFSMSGGAASKAFLLDLEQAPYKNNIKKAPVS